MRFHVNDILSSHIDAKVNDEFSAWAQKMSGSLKPVEIVRGKFHEFLGMTLNFTQEVCVMLSNIIMLKI